MLAHTSKHLTEERNSSHKISRRKDSKASTNWRDAAKEVFGDMPSTALNLRGLRNREGLTQAQLGEAIGVEQSNISKMERGERQIGAKIAKKLEKLFDIDYRLFL
ncbi:MAG: helix-turn-helix transcriptional regulator [Chlamydiales bacterium]